MSYPPSRTHTVPLPPTFNGNTVQLEEFIKNWALSAKFVLVRGSSNKLPHSSSELRHVSYVCDRGIRTKASVARPNSTPISRKINCPVRINCSYSIKAQIWTIRPIRLQHSHDPLEVLSGHSSLRRLNPDQQRSLDIMRQAGVLPRFALATLKQQDPNCLANLNTIYNANNSARRKLINSTTKIANNGEYIRTLSPSPSVDQIVNKDNNASRNSEDQLCEEKPVLSSTES